MLALIQSRQMDGLMSKKKSIFDSGTTKGSAPRKSNKKKYDENWEKIFGKKKNKDTKSK
jgi:hypothetical protein|tara:strand:+ start:188 stop:364 length:177 start_codon:yes stop_codon:yes gene_type:complete